MSQMSIDCWPAPSPEASPRAGLAALAAWLGRWPLWRRGALALLLGALAALALPPFYLWPILFLCFPVLIWVLWTASGGAALALGWGFGFGFGVASLYWVGDAVLVSGGGNGAAAVLLALAAVVAVFPAAAAWLATRFRSPLTRTLALSGAWTLTAWAQGLGPLGFPWTTVGLAWAGSDPLLQGASVAGVHGLGLVLMIAASAPALLALPTPPRWRVAALALGLPLLAWGFGAVRLAGAPEGADLGPMLALRLVQPAIPQQAKWAAAAQKRNFQTYLDLSRRDLPPEARLVIWPETAVTFFLDQAPAARAAIAAALPLGGVLITGAPRRDLDSGAVHNAALVLDDGGRVRAVYDKAHLVPFGEYIPLRGLLPWRQLALGEDYTPGPGVRTLDLPDAPPVGVLICFEVLFSGAVVDPARRPAWLLNLTNDAWYGDTSGPRQHFAITRLRAVEEGLPLARAAGTGISAAFDAWGRTLGRLELNQAGVLDLHLPLRTPGLTLFARAGHGPALLLAALLLGVLWAVQFKGARRASPARPTSR